MHTPAIKTQSSGFTLIEIMIVIVIMGILAAIIVPKFMHRPEQARQVRAQQDIMAIQSAMDLYMLDNGFYPSTEQGIAALVKPPQGSPQPRNWHRYLAHEPIDPWQQPYHYRNPGEHGDIDIFTYGKTKQPNTEDQINNWS